MLNTRSILFTLCLLTLTLSRSAKINSGIDMGVVPPHNLSQEDYEKYFGHKFNADDPAHIDPAKIHANMLGTFFLTKIHRQT